MSGAVPLLRLCAFIVRRETPSPLQKMTAVSS